MASLTAHRQLFSAYLRPQRGRVLLLALLVLVGIGLQLLSPQILAAFIDATQDGVATSALVMAALLYLLVGMAQHGLTLATVSMSLDVGWQATNALRADLLRHLLRLDMPFHKAHTPGELIERVDGDVSSLGQFFAEFLVRVAANVLLIAAILALVWRANLLAGVALLIYTAVTILALLLVQRVGVRRWFEARTAWAEQMGFIEEHYAGAEDIRGVGAEAYVLQRLIVFMRTLTEKARAGSMAQALGFAVTNFLYVMGYGLGLALGAFLYSRGEVSIGVAFLLVSYIGMLATPLDALRGQGEILQQASASVQRVSALFGLRLKEEAEAEAEANENELVNTPSSNHQSPIAEAGALGVEFDHVSFAYADVAPSAPSSADDATPDQAAPPTLHEITLHMPPGHVLGVLGRTGSGKTTLTRLLCRLYDPDSGVITLGGADLRALPLDGLRRRVGVVTQDVQLFQATLRDNITFFDRTIADSAIEAALAELGLLEWVRAMPRGLDTPLAAGGQGFSAGEAQLLAFTRLLLRDPGLVILDEAASRLDPITERRLEQAIDRLLRNRTALIVAHRLQTVQRADDILILDAGRIVEYGPRARLSADPTSRFARLLNTGLEEVLA